MMNINQTNAKKLVLQAGYEKIYTEKVASNGGNSAKINCKKEFRGKEVIVFILKDRSGHGT